eukprot:COSAG01_NODE_1072_length_11863_cov_13.614587_10_plen_69_part_00
MSAGGASRTSAFIIVVAVGAAGRAGRRGAVAAAGRLAAGCLLAAWLLAAGAGRLPGGEIQLLLHFFIG